MSTASTTNSTTALPRSSRGAPLRGEAHGSLGLQERPAHDVEPVVGAEQPEHRNGCHDANLDDPHTIDHRLAAGDVPRVVAMTATR